MDVYLARQPIFNRSGDVYGYEILYRDSNENRFDESDADFASGNALTRCFIDFGVDEFTSGKKAFINFTDEFLKNGIATIFPKDLLVIEILESILITPEILDKCRELKEQGYLLAIDDFTYQPGYEQLIPLIDIIKVDFHITTPEQRAEILRRYKGGPEFLAEKIETPEEYHAAVQMGYTYFQGYYLSRPEISRTKKVIPFKQNRLQLIQLLREEEPDFDTLAALIESDPAFSYEILRLVNSADDGRTRQVTSIRFALTLLGANEIKIWLYLAFISDLRHDSPEELVTTSVLRGKCLEGLAVRAGRRDIASEMLTIGMFSNIDQIRGAPMRTVIKDLNLSDKIRRILCGEETDGFEARCYHALISMENGNWESTCAFLSNLPVGVDELNDAYLQALHFLKTVNPF